MYIDTARTSPVCSSLAWFQIRVGLFNICYVIVLSHILAVEGITRVSPCGNRVLPAVPRCIIIDRTVVRNMILRKPSIKLD